jgi:hypothetical protein
VGPPHDHMRNMSRKQSETMPSNKWPTIFDTATATLARSPRTTICAESAPTTREGEGYFPAEGCLRPDCDDKFLKPLISPTKSCCAMADSSTNLPINLKEMFVDVTRERVPARGVGSGAWQHVRALCDDQRIARRGCSWKALALTTEPVGQIAIFRQL